MCGTKFIGEIVVKSFLLYCCMFFVFPVHGRDLCQRVSTMEGDTKSVSFHLRALFSPAEWDRILPDSGLASLSSQERQMLASFAGRRDQVEVWLRIRYYKALANIARLLPYIDDEQAARFIYQYLPLFFQVIDVAERKIQLAVFLDSLESFYNNLGFQLSQGRGFSEAYQSAFLSWVEIAEDKGILNREVDGKRAMVNQCFF